VGYLALRGCAVVKISVLCWDLGHNCFGRAYLLADALSDTYDVEIVGRSVDSRVWAPLADQTKVPVRRLANSSTEEFLGVANGEVLLACKPKASSFGLALRARKRSRQPLILDIDDWETGFFRASPLANRIYQSPQIWRPDGPTRTWALERRAHRADVVITSNTFLSKMFGGHLIPHFRDTTEFRPGLFDRSQVRRDLGISGDQHVILFLGTPRPHKGLFELEAAVRALKRDDVTLLVVGASDDDIRRFPTGRHIKMLGPQPFMAVPRFMEAADSVAIFQEDSAASRGQLPAKLFDAMAMAKPIVASGVSDMTMILSGCGFIVPPNDLDALRAGLVKLIEDPACAQALGVAARERCVRSYSRAAMRPKLEAVVQQAVARAGA
jgi:glycosyltransferase involved in cell wall biosynthesis